MDIDDISADIHRHLRRSSRHSGHRIGHNVAGQTLRRSAAETERVCKNLNAAGIRVEGDSTVPRDDPRVASTPTLNVALSEAMRVKNLSPRRLAQRISVDEKTVDRWLNDASIKVRKHNAHSAGRELDRAPHELWPDQFPAPAEPVTLTRPASVTFNPTMYASRTQVPVAVWQEHFADAKSHIDILVLAATFLFDTVDGFTDLLVDAAARGVKVRVLVGDPAAPNMAIRGEEEGIGNWVKARCHNTVELLAPYAAAAGLQVRTHQTTLYTSIFRVDDNVTANFHIYGSPGRNNPVMTFARNDEPRLWATLEQAFTAVWDRAEPLISATNAAP